MHFLYWLYHALGFFLDYTGWGTIITRTRKANLSKPYIKETSTTLFDYRTALGGLGLVGAWLKVAPDSRSSVKVAKSLTRIREALGY